MASFFWFSDVIENQDSETVIDVDVVEDIEETKLRINDFLFILQLIGNDFLPKTPAFKDPETRITAIIDLYNISELKQPIIDYNFSSLELYQSANDNSQNAIQYFSNTDSV